MCGCPPLLSQDSKQIPALKTASDSRWHVLAGLRFILAMVVVAGHLLWFVPNQQPWVFLESLGGTSAVLGFLIISGYSIAHSLKQRPVGFYRRRLLRIYPLYVVAVLFSLLPFWSGADAFGVPGNVFARPHLWVVLGNLAMLQNIICLPIDSNILVWTLGIEVMCYLLAPLLTRKGSPLLLILLAISASSYALFPKMGLSHYATLRGGLPLLLFAWAWLAGFLLHRWCNSIAAGIGVVALCTLMLLTNRLYITSLSLPALALSAALAAAAPVIPVPKPARRLLNYLGDLSYPLYLLHLPAFLLVYGVMNNSNSTALLAAAIALSAGFLFIESILRPVLLRTSSRNSIPTAA